MVDLNTPGGRARERRKELGLSLDDVAARLGVHFTTVAKWEKSLRRPSDEIIHAWAEALETTGEHIAPGVKPRGAIRMVPLVGRIPAGNWREAIQDPTGWVPAIDGGPNSFALLPDGDSMNLVVVPGTVIIIDPDQFELLDGKVYAVMNGEGETTFKRFRAAPPRLEPCSDNPSHQPIALGREPFTVVGRAVAHAGLL